MLSQLNHPSFYSSFNQGLLDFLAHSPTPFHAVENMRQQLTEQGFHELSDMDSLTPQLEANQGYFTIRNDSAIAAWRMGDTTDTVQRVAMVGAHTDSPCLKVKPQAEMVNANYLCLGVETYGGVLLSTWFDRDLTLAGRVIFRNSQQQLQSALVNFERPMCSIPSLAIHLTTNDGHKINPQTEMPLVFSLDTKINFRELLQEQLQKQYPQSDCCEVIEYELFGADIQPPCFKGLHNEFIASARIDNLFSCYVGLQALLFAQGETSLLICNDHEEVGSQSVVGAEGTLLNDVLTLIEPQPERRIKLCQNSLMISADNAHGIHPNYIAKHDPQHAPVLNKGPVIKFNANQRYATNSIGASWVQEYGRLAQVPLQRIVTRSDMRCGSTIGPITATKLGINTVDVGVPQWAMHSIRETAGSEDAFMLLKLLLQHYQYAGSYAIPKLTQ